MSKRKKQSSGIGEGLCAFGVVFAIYATVFKPHSLSGWFLAAAVSFLVGAVVRVMAQGLDTSTNQKTPESLKKMQGETGDPEVDALLDKGREMIAEIRRENDLIPDSGLSDKLDQLEDRCAEIFRTVYDKPGKASQICKFMEYYLPTTLKMVKGYRMLDERGVSGAEAAHAKNRIDDALAVVLQGCDKMLSKLYQDDVLDLTTDIDVLEQMLKRDGLTESDLEAAAEQARRASRIDRAAARIHQQKQSAPKAEVAQTVQPAQPQWHIDPRFQPSEQAAAQARQPEDK